MTKSVVLADPRGFCAGVDRAILTVQTILKAAEASGKRTREDGLPPVYVRRQIVHNKHVVEDLAGQGAVFVQELAEIPDAAAQAGIPVVFSAHGVSPVVKAEAERRGMHVVDATCPLVGKVHREVLRFVREGYEIVYIGHKGHDEAVGVVGESPEHVHLIEHESDVDSLDFAPDTKLVLLSQTTLSVDETADTIAALKAKFPWIQEPPSSDICYARSHRQAAGKLVYRKIQLCNRFFNRQAVFFPHCTAIQIFGNRCQTQARFIRDILHRCRHSTWAFGASFSARNAAYPFTSFSSCFYPLQLVLPFPFLYRSKKAFQLIRWK